MAMDVFTTLQQGFDDAVLTTINDGSARMISAISPLVGAAFSIHVMFVMLSYLRGTNEIPIVDFMTKTLGWFTAIVLGMNVQYYSQYVVPFFNGFGDDIAAAITHGQTGAAAMDSLLGLYVDAIKNSFNQLNPGDLQLGLWLELLSIAWALAMSGTIFLGIACAYVILAKCALGLLLALGPMFIACALFPPTRRFFDGWVGQCLNYGLLVALYAAVGAIEVSYATSHLPQTFSSSDYMLTWMTIVKIWASGIVFIIISLNLPSMASQLTGGVGISSMVGNLSGAVRAMNQLRKAGKSGGGAAGGGSIGKS